MCGDFLMAAENAAYKTKVAAPDKKKKKIKVASH